MEKIVPNKNDYITKLRVGVYEICFQKKDETVKVIVGTLIRSLIPVNVIEKFVNHQVNNPNIISVYNLQTGKWASIRLTHIATFKKLNRVA